MLELRVRRSQSIFSTVYIFFVSWEEKGCYHDFSIEQVGFASAASVCNDLKQIIFFGAFSIFESGGITKHLMTAPSGNSEFCFPSTSMFPSPSPRGALRVSGKQNSLFPLWPVIKCLLFVRQNWIIITQITCSLFYFLLFYCKQNLWHNLARSGWWTELKI